jgi:hypothetical protein
MGFKESINEYGKQITASFSCGGRTYTDSQIVSMTPHYDGSLFSSVMRCMDIQLEGVPAITFADGIAVAGIAIAGIAVASEHNDIVTVKTPRFGVKAPGESDYNYKNYGTYIIKTSKYDDDAATLNLECYDLMIQSMIPYDIQLDYSAGVTVKNLLDAICLRLGWNIGYTTFTNSDVAIDREKFDSSYTFRDVLDQIAQVAAGVIAFKDDALRVLYPTRTGEIIDASNLRSLTIGEKYGPINSVVLARTPQEDNIFAQDANSIRANGLTEVKIENNQIMDSHREDFIDAILERLNGLQFWLYDLQSFGIGYLDLCDMFMLETLDGVQHEAIMLSDEMQITQSLAENSSLEAPEATETDYKAASTTDRLLNKTVLKVDKQAQEISALVTKTESVSNDLSGLSQSVTKMAEVMMDSEKVDIKISQAIGEINSVTTETGYTFDQDGLHIKKSGEAMENLLDNTGMYVNRGEDNILTANNEGVDAINLRSRQFLIIGNNSRFENYNNGTDSKRTACFYIGG